MKNKTKYRNHIVQISKPEKEVMKTATLPCGYQSEGFL